MQSVVPMISQISGRGPPGHELPLPKSQKATCRHANDMGPNANWTPIGNHSDSCMSKGTGSFELNTFQYSHPNPGKGALYTQHGMIRTSNPAPHRPELKVYQRRPFLMNEYYNSGCAPAYCSSAVDVYPTGAPACSGPQTSSWDDKALDPYFKSTDPFISNSVPTSAVCYKGISPNSTAGWIFVSPAGSSGNTTVPMWSLNE